jgi:hypothetical protein
VLPIEQQLQELANRVSALEASFDKTIPNILHTVCRILQVTHEDVWIVKRTAPTWKEARERTWFILYLLGHSYESIGGYTGFSAYLVRQGVMAYKMKLEIQHPAEPTPSQIELQDLTALDFSGTMTFPSRQGSNP